MCEVLINHMKTDEKLKYSQRHSLWFLRVGCKPMSFVLSLSPFLCSLMCLQWALIFLAQ